MKLDKEQFLKKETAKTTLSLWGDKITFTPYLCENVIGDGEQLIYVQALSSRPLYWLVLIDSKTDTSSEDFDLEEVLNIIEDECGRCNEYCENCNGEICDYPAMYWDGGCWGVLANFRTGWVRTIIK